VRDRGGDLSSDDELRGVHDLGLGLGGTSSTLSDDEDSGDFEGIPSVVRHQQLPDGGPVIRVAGYASEDEYDHVTSHDRSAGSPLLVSGTSIDVRTAHVVVEPDTEADAAAPLLPAADRDMGDVYDQVAADDDVYEEIIVTRSGQLVKQRKGGVAFNVS
jgi:hypothetical protein